MELEQVLMYIVWVLNKNSLRNNKRSWNQHFEHNKWHQRRPSLEEETKEETKESWKRIMDRNTNGRQIKRQHHHWWSKKSAPVHGTLAERSNICSGQELRPTTVPNFDTGSQHQNWHSCDAYFRRLDNNKKENTRIAENLVVTDI